MSIDERVSDAAASGREGRAGDQEFQRLDEFFQRMREEGVATQKKYDLPQMDTIGRHAAAQGPKHSADSAPASAPYPGTRVARK